MNEVITYIQKVLKDVRGFKCLAQTGSFVISCQLNMYCSSVFFACQTGGHSQEELAKAKMPVAAKDKRIDGTGFRETIWSVKKGSGETVESTHPLCAISLLLIHLLP